MPAQDWSRVVRAKRSKTNSDANSVSIAEVVRHFGGEVKEGRNVSVRCCMHDDSRKSAVIDTYNNLYYCHTCIRVSKTRKKIRWIIKIRRVLKIFVFLHF